MEVNNLNYQMEVNNLNYQMEVNNLNLIGLQKDQPYLSTKQKDI